MTVKTRPKPTRKTGTYRPPSARRPSGSPRRRRPSRPNIASRIQNFFNVNGAGVWPLAGAAVGLVLAVAFLGPLINAVEAVLRTLGFGVAIVLTAVALDLRSALRQPQVTKGYLRMFAGLHLLAAFFIGLLGALTPAWNLGDVHFGDVSLGGNVGLFFVGSFPGVALWIAAGGTGFSLVWPRRAAQIGRGLRETGRFIASLEIPQRTFHAVASFVSVLLPRPDDRYDEDDRHLLDTPFAGELDEEWEESEPIIEEDEPEPEPAVKAKKDIIVSTEPEDEPEGMQPGLPMGRPAGRGWELPPVSALATAADVEVRPLDNESRSQLIVDTLGSFGVDARVVSIASGPTVTQFGVEPGWEVKTRTVGLKDERGKPMLDPQGRPVTRQEIVSKTRVRVNRITALANDLALALAAPTIRIEAPVPGKPIVGIEVPNHTSSMVSLRSVVESSAFQKANQKSKLAIALGKGVSGEPLAADLGKMPHLLIAGSTGSGKSVCINSIIAGYLLHNTPEEMRLVLIDPKRVELTTYNRVPHLAFSKVIVDMDEVVGTLQAVIHEMDSRYRRFAELGVRNIEAYNKSPRASHRLPYWVVIIDELADLMMAAPYEVERQICRLAQLARATGIHLIVATQRPSVDVITGLIKANFPTRIAFSVSSQVDSRTIIDGVGAEKLLGRGDMLFMATDAAKPRRIQGSFVSDEEIEQIVDWWANDRFRHLAPDKLDHLIEEVATENEAREPGEKSAAAEEDPLYDAARELAMEHSRVSTSLLQRRLHIGYPRAATLIDLLEDEGVIGPVEGTGNSRTVLMQNSDRDGFGDSDFYDEDEDAARFE